MTTESTTSAGESRSYDIAALFLIYLLLPSLSIIQDSSVHSSERTILFIQAKQLLFNTNITIVSYLKVNYSILQGYKRSCCDRFTLNKNHVDIFTQCFRTQSRKLVEIFIKPLQSISEHRIHVNGRSVQVLPGLAHSRWQEDSASVAWCLPLPPSC